ncbi:MULTISPECIES: hypothetical protein [Paenibacillus]|uniref:Secreted protein n=1 Tax=Paenibacillus albicereus TaxID=2726185 RepID=A0A6H2GWD3_9BACL|nr:MULTISPECIES: hypothetical protein [Paenibacillus]KKC46043.1 hypothetical protein VE23_01215 [Paenibacillus sp. D9]QJC51669.1 hypothetical protein HGI30_08995 [Paenibacillus albicereus]CDN41305.1 hypothetical protein BN871_AE_00500 [Paenibacillus sp. P22]
MKKKIILVAAAVLVLSILAACGKAGDKKPAGGNNHAGHGAISGQENAEKPAGNEKKEAGEMDHGGGHGGHGADAKPAAENLQASFAFPAGAAKANEETELTIQVKDKDGKPVNKYDVNHEKLLHLIIVNHDLSFFNHIHPEFKGDGTFTVNTSFPAGGEYKVFADFIPTGGANTTLSEWVKVEGKEGKHAAIAADANLVKEVDGKEIELSMSAAKPKEDVTLTFNIRDAKTKKGINNLQPYLGAVGHVVILSEDANQYLHVHPIDEKATGPDAKFATSFPQSGTFKIWGQFQHNGEVFTVPFVVNVR